MNYPITVLLNKTVDDISKYVLDTAKDRNIPMDLMSFVMDSVDIKIKNEAIMTLTDMNIETINTLDKALNNKEAKSE